jgi:phosphoenolpyruvate-protein phosphotransferase
MTSATLSLTAFVGGTVVPIDAVPDAVFAQRLMGDGVAIEPTSGVLHAPCAGRIAQVHASQHACTIETDGGARLLLHIGLDTVLLKGEGFVARVAAGDHVAAGQALIEFDAKVLARHGKPALTVLAVENSDEHAIVWCSDAKVVAVGDALLAISCAADVASTRTEASGDGETAHGWATVRHAGGLHARPSALVGNAVKPFPARVEVRSRGRTASARSATALMGLGVAEGEEVQLVANGARAGDALEAAIVALETVTAASHAPTAPVAGVSPVSRAVGDHQLAGVIASPGLAIGTSARFAHDLGEIRETGEGVTLERRALAAALQAVVAAIEATVADAQHRGLSDQAEIFAAHRVLAEDPELCAAADRLIGAGKSAAFAWRAAVERQCAALQATGNALLVERIGDLRDIERQVLRSLVGEAGATPALSKGAVLLADDLAPSDFAALAQAQVAAIVTARGGPTSHVAILARGAGIPALVAVGPQLAQLAAGLTVIVDAEQGLLDTHPSTERLDAVRRAVEERAARRAEALAQSQAQARTADGVRIEVAANVATAADAEQAFALGAEAVGLLRTELLFLERDTAPTESEQHAGYQAVVDAMQGRSVIIRTLDVGADKELAYLPMPAEENPALGLRGVRLSFAREALLNEQLGAILSIEPLCAVRVMLPMVTDAAEIREARAALDRIAAQRGIGERVQLGVMIETPSAAVLADQLAVEADFFSVGTNDLTQYTLCMDRCNPDLAARLDGLHPSVLRLIGIAAEGGAKHGRWLGVCGAMASESLAVPLLIGLGVTELSASPAVVPDIKAIVRRLNVAECRAVAQRALQLDSAAAIRALVADTWPWLAAKTAA